MQLGTIEKWSNSESGTTGTIKLLDNYVYKDMPCRKLQHDIKLSKIADPYKFVVDLCHTSSGEWEIRFPLGGR